MVKKSIAILFLLIYSTIAFGIGVDCTNNCTGTPAKDSHKIQCCCNSKHSDAGCSVTISATCKTSSQQQQITTNNISVSLSDYVIDNPIQEAGNILQVNPIQHSGIHTSVAFAKSSRELLSFIHTLRI